MLAKIKDFTTLIGMIIAVITLMKGVSEHMLQGTQRRAEHFLGIRHQFRDNESFQRITELITQDSDSLLQLRTVEKAGYAYFFEEIALLTSSGLVREQVAAFTFGVYAIRCWENKKFWQGLQQEHWVHLESFINHMKRVRENSKFDHKEMQL